MQRVLSIGEAAKRAGVSAQTLRHYDRLGLLKPSEVTEAGYRRYSEDDCARLESIRALREIGFDLETIGRLLDRQQDPGEAVRMQLDALEAQRRALERRRLVLKAAMGTDPSRQALLARLERKQTLAGLDRLEREAFLAAHLGWSADDPPASQAVWRAAIFDLPEQMNEAQLEAWLELAELASDASFRAALDRQRQAPAGIDPSALLEWELQSRHIYSDLIAAANDDRRDDEVRPLLDTWIEGLARLHSRAPDAGFLQTVLERYESADDPRMTRYWELMCRIKEMPSHAPVHARVIEWLLARVRARLASSQRPKRRRQVSH